MPRKRTTRSRKRSSIVLDRYKLGGILVTLGVLFFFSYYTAQESPLFSALSYPTNQLFGYQGSFVFFACLVITGLFILIRQRFYTKRLFKFAFILLFLVCCILNFELIGANLADWTSAGIQKSIADHGGRLGYLGIFGADYLFDGSANAIKGFFFILTLITLIAIAMYYKVTIPAIQFESMKSTYEAVKKPAKKSTSAKKSGATRSEGSGFGARAKAAIGGFIGGTDDDIEEDLVPQERLIEMKDAGVDKQTIKSILKDKLAKSVRKKEMEANVQTHIAFPKDKPTFDQSLLDKSASQDITVDEDRLLDKAQGIKNKLGEFGLEVDIEGFNIGPTVMQIKIKPRAGIKVSKIENLKKDLALGLRTKSLRVLAPIPGTDSVGIEIPNPKPQMVRLGDLFSSVEFTQSMKDNWTNLSVGKGIGGEYVIKSLEKMPHLLVAGATGSGKSVGVNGFICSLMYQNTPSELKFIMVDPKQVELGIYEGIPYLLAPIITEPEKAVKVLKRAVKHMNERYKKLKERKVRNIVEYNEKVEEEKDKMYRIVIIIDELADLMMSGNKKDTETYIARIAQMARAVGMHLILATQRPSVNVITGLIKANIPTRISFGVVSQIDSRTIIDQKGAEDLVGKGDLLYLDPKGKAPVRVQSPFISTGETEDIVKSLREKYMSNLTEDDIYHPEIMNILESKGHSGGVGDVSDADEELIEQAIELIASSRKASATMLQRKLGVGFPRAARLIDILEERGIIGPQDGARPREILI